MRRGCIYQLSRNVGKRLKRCDTSHFCSLYKQHTTSSSGKSTLSIPQIISYSLTYSNNMDKTCSIHTTFLNRQLHGGLCPATKHISLITTDKRRTGSGQTVLCSLVTPKTMNTRTLIERQVPREVSMPAKFGMFGGNFVPETLITSLKKLEAEFIYALQDTEFQVCCHFIFIFFIVIYFFAMLDMIFTNLE